VQPRGVLASFFTEGEEKRLDVVPEAPVVTNAAVERGEQVTVRPAHVAPFLFKVPALMESTGESEVSTPRSSTLDTEGGTYQHDAYDTVAENSVNPTGTLAPGSTALQNLVFPVEEVPSSATLAVTWGAVGVQYENDPVTARWTIDADDITRQTGDIEGLSAGQSVRVADSNDTTQYVVTAVEANEEAISESDNRRVLVTLRASAKRRSSGVPTGDNTSLLGDDTEYTPQSYEGDDAFEIDPETTVGDREGVISFEVPQSADSYRFRLPLTSSLAVVWEL